jgi:hypothetical protein
MRIPEYERRNRRRARFARSNDMAAVNAGRPGCSETVATWKCPVLIRGRTRGVASEDFPRATTQGHFTSMTRARSHEEARSNGKGYSDLQRLSSDNCFADLVSTWTNVLYGQIFFKTGSIGSLFPTAIQHLLQEPLHY